MDAGRPQRARMIRKSAKRFSDQGQAQQKLADERQDADVKSCGPGIPELMPSATRVARCRDMGAREPVPRESTYKR